MSEKPSRGFAFHVLTSTIANFAVPLSALATAPILARALGASGRGELAAATAPLFLLSAVAMLGLPESVTYHSARATGSSRKITGKASILLGVSGALSFLGTWLLSPILSDGNANLAALIVVGSSALIPATILGALRATAAAHHQWSRVNAEKYITSFLKLVLVAALAISGTLTVLTAVLVIAFVPVLGYLPYIGRLSKTTATAVEPVTFKSLLNYGSAIWVGSLSGVVLSRIDQLLIVPLTGSVVQLGFYAAAVNVGDVALLANNAVRDVTFTSESKSGSDERLHVSARMSFMVSLAVGVALIATIPLWFVWLFGDDFASAVPVAQLLVAASVAGVPGSVGGAGLSARGRPGLRSISLICAAIVNVALLVVLLPILGALGAAIATLAGNIIAANLNLIFLRRVFGVKFLPFYSLRPSDAVLLWRLLVRVFRRAS